MPRSSVKKHTVLNLIIRSSSVYAQVLFVDGKGRSEVLQTEITPIFLEGIKDSKEYTIKIIQEVNNTLVELNQRFRKEDGGSIDYIAVYHSSPWFSSDVRTFDVSSEKDSVVFTKDTMKSVLRESAQSLKDEYKKDGTVKPIEQHISNIQLNGYDITEPYGKKYQTGLVSLITTWVDHSFQTDVLQVLGREFPHAQILHFSFPYSLITTMDTLPETRTCILDVHGEVTDIVFVKDNIIESMQSIPVGTNHLLKSMNHDSFTSQKQQKRFLDMISKDYIDQKASEEHKNVCEAEVLKWYESLINVPYFKVSESYVILTEEPFRSFFEECLQKQKGIEIQQNIDVQSYVFESTGKFWIRYTQTHPKHLHRLQK